MFKVLLNAFSRERGYIVEGEGRIFLFENRGSKFKMPEPRIIVVKFDWSFANVAKEREKSMTRIVEMKEENFMITDNSLMYG